MNKIDDLVNDHIKALAPKPALPTKGNQAISLDKGELPYPPSPRVVEAIANAAKTVNRYPDVLGGSLRGALAEYAGVKTEQIVVGNGSDDIIELIVKVFVQPGDKTLLPTPTFVIYDLATRVVGGKPIHVSRTADFGLDVKALLEVAPRTKVLFLANPNNPTANSIAREVIVEILDRVECLVVVDECYYEFCQETVADLVGQYPNLIVLRSLSKSFGLAGMRVGYGIANEFTIDYLYRAAQMFPVNELAMIAANAALADQAYVHSKIEQVWQERKALAQQLEGLGFLLYPSATNFLFVSTKPLGISSKDLVKALRDKNIFVADFGLKQGLDAYYFRVSVGTPRENQTFLQGVEAIATSIKEDY